MEIKMTVRKPIQSCLQRSLTSPRAVLTGVLLAATLLATACSGPPASAGGVPTNGTAAAPAPAGTGSSSDGGGRTYSITMSDSNQFRPASLTVPKGATVTWQNTGQGTHTVTSDPAKAINKTDAALPSGVHAWDSGNVAGGQFFTHTFDVPGTYKYFCVPHESLGMVGTLTVTS